MRTAVASFALVLGLGAGLAACAPTGGPSTSSSTTSAAAGRQCFPIQSVNGFSALDRETVNVNVGVRDVYQFKLFGTCQDVDWAQVVGLRSRGGGSFICNALDVEVISPSTLGPQRCQVSSIRKLSEAEVAAFKASPKPKS